ncbi:MAG TPA: nitroreductase family deazaflavin-dependent oxidoreductase [Acidimicrobiales bacterium]|nr:nitroreductase family deazaflavin-dependent oxidoreductase [Acidimicrobiales bacterium]
MSTTPVLGLRRKPGRLALAVFRLPLGLYRRGHGWLLGRTFLVFTHVGHSSGKRYEAVAMVLGYDEHTAEAVICSAWGPTTDWVRNLRANPAVEVTCGHFTFSPEQRFLSDDEALRVLVAFTHRHPWRARLLSAVLGLGDLRSEAVLHQFVGSHPFVSFRPVRR